MRVGWFVDDIQDNLHIQLIYHSFTWTADKKAVIVNSMSRSWGLIPVNQEHSRDKLRGDGISHN